MLVTAAAVACVVASRSLMAQTIRGRVLRSDSLTPMPGIVVTALSRDGAIAATALSGATGDYQLALPRPGQYQLRALRIGFHPAIVAPIDVIDGTIRVSDIILTEVPIDLTALQIRGERACDLRPSDAATLLPLWEQARGALIATRLVDARRDLQVRVVTINGHVDAEHYHTDPGYGPLLRAPHAEADTLHARESVSDHELASTPADTLLTAGYRRPLPDGSVVFDSPSADVLLSDAFIERHCFSIAAPPDDHPDWTGIEFEPKARLDSSVGIRGTLWLDRTSSDLRRVEFEYTNVPFPNVKLCDPDPDLRHWPSGIPVCETVSSVRLGLGGTEDFLRLSNGEWLVARWTMRMAPDQIKRRFSGIRWRQTSVGQEKCFGGPNCTEIWIGWPRLVTTTRFIESAQRGGVEIYRNDSAKALINTMAARRAGRHPARLIGVILDDHDQPLSGAMVQIEDPGLVATTNQGGVFSVDRLPPGPVTIIARLCGYLPARLALSLVPDSTQRTELRLVADGSRARAPCKGQTREAR